MFQDLYYNKNTEELVENTINILLIYVYFYSDS